MENASFKDAFPGQLARQAMGRMSVKFPYPYIDFSCYEVSELSPLDETRRSPIPS
jgi:hypothetical protein